MKTNGKPPVGKTPVVQEAYKFGTFAQAIDKSRSWLYALPPEKQPISVKFGRNRLILEKPQEFLRRIAEKR